jgi:hypothetical protein
MIKHNGEHMMNFIWIINFQKLQYMFHIHFNNFNLHVILKDEDLNIKIIMKNINILFQPCFQSECPVNVN